MKNTPPLLFYLFFSFLSHAQGWHPAGSRSTALAGASVCIDDAWAYHHNPGALANIRKFSAGVYYDARFLTKELQTQAVTVVVPLKTGVISVGGQAFGYEQLRLVKAGAGYSLLLGEKIGAGIQMNMQHLRFGGNYGSSYNATFETGILAKISAKWQLGISVMNIGRQRIRPLEERFTSVMRIGARYRPSSKVSVLFEAEKQVVYPISFRAGLEYLPIESFVLRFGAQSGPTELAFGFGYRKNAFLIDAGTKYHPVLGWTPNAGLTYEFSKHAE